MSKLQRVNCQVFLRLMTELGVSKDCDVYQDIGK